MFSRLNWQLFLRVGVSATLIFWLVSSFNQQEAFKAIRGINYLWIFGAALWVIGAVAVSVIKWRIILRTQGLRLGWQELWKAYWVGLFFNNFLPSSIGGDAVRIYWVGKSTGNTAGAAASVVIERILATAGLALVGALACLLVAEPLWEVKLLFMLLIGVSFGLLALMLKEDTPSFLRTLTNQGDYTGSNRFYLGFKRIINLVKGFLAEVHQQSNLIRQRPRDIIWVTLWSMVFQLCVGAVNYSIFRGLGVVQLNIAEVMYIIPATSVAAMLPLSINGYGLREGAYIALLAPYGVPKLEAFTVALLFGLLVSLLSLWGGWVWLVRREDKGEQDYVSIEGI